MPEQNPRDLPPPSPFVDYGIGPKLEASRTALSVYVGLLESRRRGLGQVDQRLGQQSEIVLDALRPLRTEVASIEREAEGKRLRRWGVGGGIAALAQPAASWMAETFFPHGFRVPLGPADHAVHRRLCQLYLSRPGCESFTAFVLMAFGFLLVAHNELVLGVSRRVLGRLGALYAGVEARDEGLGEAEGDELEGWQWDALLWWK